MARTVGAKNKYTPEQRKLRDELGITNEQLDELLLELRIEVAQQDFWEFCKLLAPDFYKEGRDYLKEFCYAMQEFYESESEQVLIINMPPRHGKSRTSQLFALWIFGRNPSEKIITGSYNEQLSTTFSKNVRNSIQEKKASKDRVVYSDIFPNTKMKKGSTAANMWTLEGEHVSYLATSPGGTVTGFGATVMILDDIVKNAEEALNETVLENHWSWFCFTGETLVTTHKGKIPIKDLHVGDKVLSFNHSECIIEEKEIVKVDSHLSSIYTLEFENGKTIECTGNHKFFTNKGYLSIEQILSLLRCPIEEGETILFSDLQKQSESWSGCEDKLFELWKRDSFREKEQTEQILFCELQERVQSEKREGSLCRVGKNKRQLEERSWEMPEMRFYGESSSTSYRPQYKEQRCGESDSSMYILPLRLSQITRLSSNNLRRVYDIEVKDNHNFFANDVLVHNCNTMLSRLESHEHVSKLLIVATRWNTNDLSGRAIEHYKAIGVPFRLITKAAKQEDGTMLCDDVLSLESYNLIAKTMSPETLEANYNQKPIDLVGRLYSMGFETYKSLPKDDKGNDVYDAIHAYIDTADQGNDYLCCLIYAVYRGQAYILDIYFTKDNMEITEPKTAELLYKWKVNKAYIESNNGGRGFGRSVERILRDKFHWFKTYIDLFTQRKNKKSRILSSATWCQKNIKMPLGWEVNHEEFYKDVMSYQKEGKMAHDDAEDALAGIYDKMGRGDLFSFV